MRILHSSRVIGLAALIALSAGCAGRPVILEQSSFWPFNSVRLQTAAVGPLTAYFHDAPQPTRAVVILQSQPCTGTTAGASFGTGGILWDELKQDSLLLQLEQPGLLRNRAGPPAADCRPELRGRIDARTWGRAIKEALAAVQQQRKLDLPTVYIGIGNGALPAAQLAAADSRAMRLVIVNGVGLHPEFERLLATLHTQADASPPVTSISKRVDGNAMAQVGKVATLFVHGSANRESPVESALLSFSQLASGGANTAMVLIEGQGADFGLGSDRPECFENVMRLIAASTRDASPAALTRINCERAPAQPAE